MDRNLFTTLCLFALLLALIALTGTIVAPLLPALGWAMIIAVITFPLFRHLRSALDGRDMLSAGCMTALIVVALILPIIAVIITLTHEATLAYRFLEPLGAEGIRKLFAPLSSLPLVQGLMKRLQPLLANLPLDLETSLVPAAKQLAGVLLGYSTTVLKNTIALLFQLFFMTITLFFCYRDGERLLQKVWGMFPAAPETRELVEQTVSRVLNAVVFGIFLTCVVQGILGGLAFWVAGLPSPLLFGALMIATAFIPVVGTALVWLPGGLYLLAQGETAAGIGVLIWGALVVGSIDNLIRPLFISGKAQLPILMIAVGALGGLLAFGLIGIVLGPLALALPLALLETVNTSQNE
jgi:predicted PurR-regulated permease PerM